MKLIVRFKFLLVVFLLALLSLMRTSGLRDYRDLSFDDETGYIHAALMYSDFGPLDPQYGPLYIFWYRLMHQIFVNPLDLFYGNWVVLHFAACLLFFLILLEFRCRFMVALAASVLMGVLSIFEIGPYASLFGTCLVLFGFLISFRFSKLENRLFFMASCLLAFAYARPELFWASGLVLLVSLFFAFLRKSYRSIILGLGTYAFVFGLGISTLGPLIKPFQKIETLSTGRGTVAFGTLYAFHYVKRHHITNVDPWTEWTKIVADNFPGNPLSLSELFLANPKEFSIHLLTNAMGLYAPARLLVPEWPVGKAVQTVCGGLLILVFGMFVFKYFRTAGISRLKERFVQNPNISSFIIIGMCIGLNNLAAVLIIYPRYHYLVLSTTLCMVLIFLVVDRVLRALSVPRVNLVVLLLVIAHLLAAPSRDSLKPWWVTLLKEHRDPSLEGLAMVKAIQESPWQGSRELKLLESDFSRVVYTDFRRVAPTGQECRKLLECLESERYDMVAVDSRFRLQWEHRDPDGFQALLGDPGKVGYAEIPVNFPGAQLFVRKDRLGNG